MQQVHKQLGHGVDTRATNNLGSDVLLHVLLHSQADPPVLQGLVLPHVEVVVSYFLLCCKKTTGRASTLLNKLSFNFKIGDFGFTFIDDCSFIKCVFDQLAVSVLEEIPLLVHRRGYGQDGVHHCRERLYHPGG